MLNVPAPELLIFSELTSNSFPLPPNALTPATAILLMLMQSVAAGQAVPPGAELQVKLINVLLGSVTTGEEPKLPNDMERLARASGAQASWANTTAMAHAAPALKPRSREILTSHKLFPPLVVSPVLLVKTAHFH
jgi:hypothetical protein